MFVDVYFLQLAINHCTYIATFEWGLQIIQLDYITLSQQNCQKRNVLRAIRGHCTTAMYNIHQYKKYIDCDQTKECPPL